MIGVYIKAPPHEERLSSETHPWGVIGVEASTLGKGLKGLFYSINLQTTPTSMVYLSIWRSPRSGLRSLLPGPSDAEAFLRKRGQHHDQGALAQDLGLTSTQPRVPLSKNKTTYCFKGTEKELQDVVSEVRYAAVRHRNGEPRFVC